MEEKDSNETFFNRSCMKELQVVLLLELEFQHFSHAIWHTVQTLT